MPQRGQCSVPRKYFCPGSFSLKIFWQMIFWLEDNKDILAHELFRIELCESDPAPINSLESNFVES